MCIETWKICERKLYPITTVFEWHKRFCVGREEVEDNQWVGRPCSSKTNDNISKINEIVRKYRRLSIQMIAEMVNIDKYCTMN
ncbi:protein GVQW3-like [Aphis craccivora]|uniref:Protein GVQW3-like n=1 Tax=Aphis craccivora TaxID=307492 RepID=A0A6G0YM03_APHCR|nr:protein GVQW3-like [Aphis craccivora]